MTTAVAVNTDAKPYIRFIVPTLLAGLAAALIWGGIVLRRNTWARTEAIHYEGDVFHGWGWGQIGKRLGVFNVYDLYVNGQIRSYPNELDYTPLRLAIVTAWARWAETHVPDARGWSDDYELNRFMLRINTAAELASSILVFLLVRHWVSRGQGRRQRAEGRRGEISALLPSALIPLPSMQFRGVARGLLGASLFWFNPAVLWDGHGFPQWDVWNAPFFLGAALLASLDWWFAAGACVAVGAFFKGQILLVAPVFIIWPLVLGQLGAVLKFLCGFALAGAILAFPWMHPDARAIIWYMSSIAGLTLLAPVALRWKLNAIQLIGLSAASALLIWPWKSSAGLDVRSSALLVAAVVALARLSLPSLIPSLYACAIAIVTFLMIPLFGASRAWYDQGFEFGTVKIMWMATTDTYNLPWVLVRYYRWSNDPLETIGLPLFGQIPFRSFVLMIYGACLVLCGIGAAIHARRNDPRLLVALVAPWLCWFVLITQLNNRYMIWAAGFSALFVAVGVGMTLLGIVVSLIGWAGIAQIMCWSRGDPDLAQLVNPLTPHLAWPLMLAACVYLYVAAVPSRARIA